MKITRIARVTFLCILLELFCGSSGFKASHSRDETLPTVINSTISRGGVLSKAKTCKSIHSIVTNVSLDPKNSKRMRSSIPRVIHVTFKSIEEMPQCVAESLQKLNPNFEVRKWGDKEIIKFLKTDFSQKHVDVFNFIPDGEIKADMFRLAVMWKLGGWYIDMDVGLKQPLEKFAFPDADLILSGSVSFAMVNPHILAAQPGREVMKVALERMVAKYGKGKYDYWQWSACSILFWAIRDEFGGTFEPHNLPVTATSSHGLKVQMLQERDCSFGRGTVAQDPSDLVADNIHGCQANLTDMALSNMAPHVTT